MSGDAAMKIFNDEPVIDLLLTDIVMPGELQGTTLARALRDLRHDLPVIFMSGYAREATFHGNGLRPEDIRLMKPIRREELLSAIIKALLSGENGLAGLNSRKK
jgi:CheY-like chemotaxis protein